MFAKQIIYIDALFNEHVLVKNYIPASDRKERWKNTTISYEQKWTQLLQAFKDKDISISNFQKLVVLRRNTRVCLTLRRTRKGRDVIVETQFIQ